MKKIAIIPARSGSKGLPNKNVLLADGKPLISYSIEAAIEARCFDKIIVTTDSQEYIDLLSEYPIDFIKREEHLANDQASSFVVIEDILNKYSHIELDYFVLLQPTSPLRTSQHIKESCDKFEQNFQQFDYLVSVTESSKSTSLIKQIDDGSLRHFNIDYSNYARQQYLPEYTPNGAIFSAKPKEYLLQKHFFGEKSLAYKMDKISSLDIDERNDFEYFYFILQQKNKEQILLNSIKNRIVFKQNSFNQSGDITFIGHSILDQWKIEKIGYHTINNLAISGISTREYIDLIIDKGLLRNIEKQVVLMLGTNDIVKPNWTYQSVFNDIQELIDKIRKKANLPEVELYFLEITPTAFRLDRNNQQILELNKILKEKLQDIVWVNTYHHFSNQYGKLDLAYSDDGLHLNSKGYKILENILKENLR